jgi:opine dehydrogenase
VLEDVPYGLVFNAALARIAGVPVPAADAVVATLSALYGREFRTENPLIDAFDLRAPTRQSLLARCAN